MAPCGNRWGTLRKACYAQMESWSLAVPQHSLTPTPPPDVDAPCSAGLRRFSRLRRRAGDHSVAAAVRLRPPGRRGRPARGRRRARVAPRCDGRPLRAQPDLWAADRPSRAPGHRAADRGAPDDFRARRYAREFVEAGADTITFHVEAAQDPQVVIDDIHAAGAAAGLALNPATPLASVLPFLATAELLLVMSVHPGFGGQGFETVALDKLRQLSSAWRGGRRAGSGWRRQYDDDRRVC